MVQLIQPLGKEGAKVVTNKVYPKLALRLLDCAKDDWALGHFQLQEVNHGDRCMDQGSGECQLRFKSTPARHSRAGLNDTQKL